MQELTVRLGEASTDARDLYSESALKCAGCDRGNPEVSWVLPGLCRDCALRVSAVTAPSAGAEQRPMFNLWNVTSQQQQQPALFDTFGGMRD